jgi:hypothetical protein
MMMAGLATLAVAADDPGGWSKAKWGMTDDEILKAFDGQVKRFDKVDAYQKARVGIESLEVAGVKFKVYMSPGPDDKLEHVLFTPISRDDNDDHTFQALENLLVQKYGPPWRSDDDRSETELQWSFATTIISLTRRTLPHLPGMQVQYFVNLMYKRRPQNPL